MLDTTPIAFRHVRAKRDDGTECAVCATIEPCPPCAKGFQCQQIFRSSCQTCPVNKCVQVDSDSSGSGSNASSLGGALGGVLGAAVVALAIFYFWRRSRKRRIALAQDARGRSALAQEKNKTEKGGVTLQLGGAASDVLDGDTEWTRMQGNPLESLDTVDPLQEPTVFKRRSFGAATHLSKITEGAEEEAEEEWRRQQQRTSTVDNEAYTGLHVRESSRSSAVQVGAGPRISVGSGTTFSSGNIIPIAFRPNPVSSSNSDGTAAGVAALPSPKDTVLSMPAPAHRAVGSPLIEVTGTTRPLRPTRAPDLNLRLADGAEPGKLNSKRASNGTGGSTSYDSSLQPASAAEMMLSPRSAPSYASGAGQQKFDFMSIDPAATLQQSRVYSKSERRLSTGTINTMASTSTAGFDYVLSAPQIITPVTADGARRVQLNKGGKAQLVRNASLRKKDAEAGVTSPVTTPSTAEYADPFSDAAAEPRLPAFHGPTASSGAEILLRPTDSMRLNHLSTSTLGIPFADDTFVLRAPKESSPVDADRSSWLNGRASLATSHGDRRDDRAREDSNDDELTRSHYPISFEEDRRSPFSDQAAAAAVPLLESNAPTPDQRLSAHSAAPGSKASSGSAGSMEFDLRSSRAESIGGLSVFDHFPIAIGTEPLPGDLKQKVMSFAIQEGERHQMSDGDAGEADLDDDDEGDAGLVTPRM